MNIVEFANRVDSDEVAHNEPIHLNRATLIVLKSSNSHCNKTWSKWADVNFVVCFLRFKG